MRGALSGKHYIQNERTLPTTIYTPWHYTHQGSQQQQQAEVAGRKNYTKRHLLSPTLPPPPPPPSPCLSPSLPLYNYVQYTRSIFPQPASSSTWYYSQPASYPAQQSQSQYLAALIRVPCSSGNDRPTERLTLNKRPSISLVVRLS